MTARRVTIEVGVVVGRREIGGCFAGSFRTPAGEILTGPFVLSSGPPSPPAPPPRDPFAPPGGGLPAGIEPPGVWLQTRSHRRFLPPSECRFSPLDRAVFSLDAVVIGVNFHWERRERQTFQGGLTVRRDNDGLLTAINEIDMEDYLASVISSEMAATAPVEFLKAHAVMSRSWLLAMLERKDRESGGGSAHSPGGVARGGGDGRRNGMDGDGHRNGMDGGAPAAGEGEAGRETDEGGLDSPEEIVKWYGREDHADFDVCADDHCQRYQGVTKIVSPQVREAVDATRGMVLVYGGRICDARYHKACGGRTEDFANVWEGRSVPYLTSVADGPGDFPSLTTEAAAADWIASSPEAYCNIADTAFLRRILPAFDQETPDFFRWEVSHEREEMEALLKEKSGIDFGELLHLKPLRRGPSGRIVRLEISGTRRRVIVGKELEIRRWLSPSHLYSSAFVVDAEKDAGGGIRRFVLRGAGWGHGVGLCQIGAAAMAIRGFSMEAILGHYFPGAALRKI
ncbi:MAG: SpoIID/LytB domain-containing protein [Pseudomonadota bacterium]|nr:SpoIID/LytB domain-containing protein [Pseudomonadota bacterium]